MGKGNTIGHSSLLQIMESTLASLGRKKNLFKVLSNSEFSGEQEKQTWK